MKIYTKSGDTGQTGLLGGPRVGKDHPRIASYGEVDELNAVLGLARSLGLPESIDTLLGTVQNELFDLGAELAAPDPDKYSLTRLGRTHIERLEQAIDQYEQELPPLREFILPGGTSPAAALHLARTVCRRAERRLVELAALEKISAELLIYLNRLGDLLFVLARAANHRLGAPEVKWQKQ